MNSPKNNIKIHNFYLVGKDNYESGKISDIISRKILPPTRFNFGETIQEIGYDIKLEYKEFRYYEENETIVVFEPFHFKDFDKTDLNVWLYFELFFHQGFLYGVSFSTKKVEIYEKFREYLVSIYGEYINIPDQDNTSSTVAWFIDEPYTSVYLEIEYKGDNEKFIVLTYYDNMLHTSLKYNHNIYPLVRDEAYQRDKKINISKPKKVFLSKFFKYCYPQNIQDRPNFEMIKSHCENLLSNNISKLVFTEVANYILTEIKQNDLNLEIGDWLIKLAIKIQEFQLFDESERIYNLFINWPKEQGFIASKERIELITSAYKNLINVYGYSNRNDEAINCFTNCMKLLENNGIYVNNYHYAFIAGQANFNIALVYNKIGNHNDAIKHSLKALDYFEPFVCPWINRNDITTIILGMNNLGNYLSENGDYEEAEKNYAMGMRFALDNKRYYDSSVLNMNLALNLVKQNKLKEAENQYKGLLDLINMEPEIYKGYLLKGLILVNMAKIYTVTNENGKELECLDLARIFYENYISERPEVEEHLKSINKRISDIK